MDTNTGNDRALSQGVRHRWWLVAAALVIAVLGACTTGGSSGAPNDKAILLQVKRNFYGQQAQVEASRIAAGVAQPVLPFTVQATPPSIFVNWIVPDALAADFADFVDLPPGFTLAKVRILDSDPVPRYWLSLNAYRVGGITTGLRAEWSTYVDDGSGTPRFMIVRARAAEGSLDPIGPIAYPEPFSHSLYPDEVIRTSMNRTVIQDGQPVMTPDHLFSSEIGLPEVGDRNYVAPSTEWVGANDFIYWLNGVNDRTFHNSTAHRAPLISVDLADVAIDDDTDWAPYVEPTPGHVLVYLDGIEFMIGPWWNVTEPDGRVDSATLWQLSQYKQSMYGGLAGTSALQVQLGDAEPIVQTTVEATPPSVHWHWRIPAAELAGFEAAIDLPPGLSLAAVKLEDGDAAVDHWLSLNVYEVSGSDSGLRAEWSTFVDDGSGTRLYMVEARAGYPSLDPVQVISTVYPLTASYPVTHGIAGDTIDTTVGSGASSFTSTVVVPPTGSGSEAVASREWVGAHDLRYWRNGIADRTYYESTVFAPRISVDPGDVTVLDNSAWAEFVGGAPDRVWVDQVGVDTVVNPWWNLNSWTPPPA